MSSAPKIIYESKNACLFTNLRDTKFEKAWKPWSNRYLSIYSDAVLMYRVNKDTTPNKRKLDLKSINILQMPITGIDNPDSPLASHEIGLHVECKENGYYAAFKCVLSFDEAELLLRALSNVAVEHNFDQFQPVFDAAKKKARETGNNITAEIPRENLSNMRRSIAYHMDAHEKRSRHDRIIAKRGSLEWLPVAFSNDLVHGSWWYVIGSFFTVFFPMFIIIGNHDANFRALGYDDDVLTENAYDWSWTLMMISGVFFTLGSIAFLRAVHDPPMKPFFDGHPVLGHHFGTDELLGSWNFVFACVPFVPYAFIYWNSDPSDPLVICMVVCAVLAVIGSTIFLINCYPSDDEAKPFILPLLLCCNFGHCCCSERLIDKHLQNDWLAGTWIILWTTIFGTIVTFFAFCYKMYEGTLLAKFSVGCTFVDCALFLIGSLYFVAGSYPETTEPEDTGGAVTPANRMVMSDIERAEVELKKKSSLNRERSNSSSSNSSIVTTNPLSVPLNR